jgi:hypothetical protein
MSELKALGLNVELIQNSDDMRSNGLKTKAEIEESAKSKKESK